MKWHQVSHWLDERRDIWLDLLRIYLGIGLFVRGMILFGGESGVMLRQLSGEASNEWLLTALVGHYVAIAHAAGGVMLAFGLLTRIAALAQVPILLGAVVLHASDGLFALGQSLEFSAFVLMTLLVIIVAGPGRLSVDHYTFGARRNRGDPAARPAPDAIH
jgi:uncharacterized membrane protein YphA (DoxX/SURF4 family)